MRKKMFLLAFVGICLCMANLHAVNITINENNLNKTIVCNGDEIYVNGNENVLTLKGTVAKLVVSGNQNKIMAEAIDYIGTPGNENYVSWETGVSGAKPSVNNLGRENIIKRVAVGSEAKPQAPKETKKQTKAQDASGTTIGDALGTLQDLAGGGKSTVISGNAVTITKDGLTKTITLTDQDLTITGNSNDITVLGTCLTLYITGDDNKIWLDSVARIRVNGNNNHVGWEDGYKGEDPNVVTKGSGNKVVKEDR